MTTLCRFLALSVLLVPVALRAEEPIRLQEQFTPGYQYHVSSKLTGTSTLSLPPDKDNPKGRSLEGTGDSAIDYDERILDPSKEDMQKTLRIYRRLEVQRTTGKDKMDSLLRPEVRRIVVTRANALKNGFSPDGPLTFQEIDLLRTDVFTPALTGLLPANPVRPGESWKATAEAEQELTDIDKLLGGSFDCRFESIVNFGGSKQARITLTGSVRGVDEFGPCRHEVDGFFYFDLGSKHLSYLTMRGTHFLLDKDGKETGKIEGTFTLSRRLDARPVELNDAALRGLVTEPNDDNTLLLFENAELGVRFLYSRRWHVNSVQAPQVTLDEARGTGNGLLLTVQPLKNTPAP
ncbi:MAG TPA: hypothetical protein VKS79_02675, partial [Gemmataceae bacterium]|nr:hypothetical protein [Gemmataceae bacterium]